MVNQDEYLRLISEKLKRELGRDICELLDDPTVIEIMLNPDGKLWIERLGKPMERFGYMPASQAESLMGTVAASLQRVINAQNPILECEFPLDGSRFEALFPPIVAGPAFTIRKRAIMVFTLEDYVEQGIMSPAQLSEIEKAVSERHNILIAGGTSTGKTTLTNAVVRRMVDIFPHHRLLILEDTLELQCSAENYVQLHATKEVNMTELLSATMRMRPDHLLVGEVRDGAALALLNAWNTGHPGGAATLHANSASASLLRLERLVSQVSQSPMHELIAEAVDLIVFIEKCSGSRRIREVVRVLGYEDGRYITHSTGE